MMKTLIALSLLLSAALHAGSHRPLEPEEFTFEQKGDYRYRKDPRHLFQILHPLAEAKEGDYGRMVVKAEIPADAEPPYLLTFFYDDSNEYTGDREPKSLGSRFGPIPVLKDERKDHRFATCRIDGREIWKWDVSRTSRHQPFVLDVTQRVKPGVPFELSLGLEERVDSSVRLPGDIHVQSEGRNPVETNFAFYETRSYWGDVAIYWGGERPEDGVARWTLGKELRPISLAPVKKEVQMGVEKAELLKGSRWAWPVVQGIPFGEGEVKGWKGSLTRDGKAVATGWQEMNRWKDGSLRWSLLHFTLKPEWGGESFALQPGKADRSGPKHPVSRGKKGETVGNGLIALKLGKNGLEVKGKKGASLIDGLHFYQTTGGGDLICQWEKREVSSESRWSGEARLEGKLTDPKGASVGRIRLIASIFADVPYVRFRLTTISQQPGQTVSSRYGLRFEPAWKAGESVSFNDKAGWVRYPGEEASLLFASRYFQHRWPNGVGVSEDGIDYRCFRAGDERLPELTLHHGESLSHEFWLAVTTEEVSEPDAAAFAAMVDTPPRLDSSALIRNSFVWGPIPYVSPDEPVYKRYIQERMAKTMGEPIIEGIRDYGSFSPEKAPVQSLLSNFYWNSLHTLYVMYAMTGERRWFDWAERSVEHQMNQLICHEATDDRPAGGVKYLLDHTEAARYDVKYQTLDGLFDHWQMTGDPEGRRLGIGVADFLLHSRMSQPIMESKSARAQGWPILFVMRAYRETGEKRFVESATKWAEVAASRLHPRRGSYLEKGGSSSNPGLSPFMSGILLTGLRELYQETGDEAVGEMIPKIAWSIYAENHNPDNTTAAPNIDYEYSPNPYKRNPITTLNIGISAGQAYAAAISRDPALADVAQRAYLGFLEEKEKRVGAFAAYDLAAAIFWTRYNRDHLR